MRIALILLSALVVLAFVEEASAGVPITYRRALDRAQGTGGFADMATCTVGSTDDDCAMDTTCTCQGRAGQNKGRPFYGIMGGQGRDDLNAVSDNESIIFGTEWGTWLGAMVRQVNP